LRLLSLSAGIFKLPDDRLQQFFCNFNNNHQFSS
jgi:hypothetical protein